MKHLGIDYGTKRIGLAISNNEGTLAFPKETLLNSGNIIQDIIDIIEHEHIEKIVVGKSLDTWGNPNQVQHAIDSFIKKSSYEVHNAIDIIEQDERGSSIAAASHLYGKGNIANEKWNGKLNAKKREHNDANAAAVILQRYLDILKNI